jgi:GH15 family glucan-1,4-alpha-glucosidase
MVQDKEALIFEKSIEVFRNCSLPNGAIIAADVNNPYYPRDVKWYGYVWLRDAGFVGYACNLVGLHEIPRRFFKWCLDYAEGIREGIFPHKFYPNGRAAADYDISLQEEDLRGEKKKVAKSFLKTKMAYVQFQPDQPATLLWLLYEHSRHESIEEFEELVEILANGICKLWNKTHFSLPSYDLWEERPALPEYKQVHVYILATCIKGLECATKMKENEKWKETLHQMKEVFSRCRNYARELGYFPRTFGRKVDDGIDSSLFALVWPWEQVEPDDEIMVGTVKKILKENEVNGGIMRYKGDKYDGRVKLAELELGGGGAWPILNYWASIYFCLKGEREKALKYFNWVNERSLNGYLPEQIKYDKPASIIPLAWSHAMFVIAADFLGILKKYLPR